MVVGTGMRGEDAIFCRFPFSWLFCLRVSPGQPFIFFYNNFRSISITMLIGLPPSHPISYVPRVNVDRASFLLRTGSTS